MVDSGIMLVKYWLEVEPGRADAAAREPDRRSAQDLEAVGHGPAVVQKWDEYSRARDEMFAATDTAWAPWFVAHTDDKKRGRLNMITHLLGQVPYKPVQGKKVSCPDAKVRDTGHERVAPRYIPTPF